MAATEVDEYLAGLGERHRATLERLRAQISALLPDAEQGLSYGAPVFRIGGKAIAGFSASKQHVSYLPHSGSVLGTLDPEELEGLSASKGALKIPLGAELPDPLVRRLIESRRAEAGV